MALTIIPFLFYTGPMQLAECDKIDVEALFQALWGMTSHRFHG